MTHLRTLPLVTLLLLIPVLANAEEDFGVMSGVGGTMGEIRAFGDRTNDVERNTVGLDMSGAPYAMDAVPVGQGLDARGNELAVVGVDAIVEATPIAYDPEGATADATEAPLVRRTVHPKIADDDWYSGE